MKSYYKMSQVYAPTLKEDPAEAELVSHKLLLRAGMIRRCAAGLYSYLPLAWRSIRKIETIIREEMDAIGAQEIQVPMVVPAELWQETGRYDKYGKELLKFNDRHERSFVMGPTHEETFTDLVRNELRSYRQLPVTLYQIQDKFRDEIRPRFGLMRGREFIMKDAYSFDASVEGMQASYDAQKNAYARICERCGLHALPVVADSGQIGGDTSVEFMALADAGEASIVWCDCGFAADDEAAVATIAVEEGPASADAFEKISTPGTATIESLAEFLSIPQNATRKALLLIDENKEPVLALIVGDHELNEVKAAKAFGDYHLMSDEELEEYGLIKGFIGPIGLDERIKVVADRSLTESISWLVGANEKDFHIIGARPGRDFEVDEWLDLATVQAGDACPHCGKPLHAARGIEVSQVFQLGIKYSESMGATFMDEDGSEKPFQMGCYGIGVSRTLQAVIEQSHDEHGIKFPVPVAPFEVAVVPLDVDDDLVWPAAQKLATELAEKGIEVVIDDRHERPGVKFNDMDLMGFPYQVVCGKRGIAQGNCELKDRLADTKVDVSLDELVDMLTTEIAKKRLI